MKVLSAISLAGLAMKSVSAQLLVGYGNYPYNPLCAESCLRSFSSLMLDCSGMAGSHHMMMSTTPQCFAENTPFLTSVAWCMSIKCAGTPASLIESIWEREITGSRRVAAKWTYSEALANVDPKPPTHQLNRSDTDLNVTSLVVPSTYLAQWNVLGAVNHESVMESTYGIIIISAAVGIPVLLTTLAYMPFMGSIVDKIKPYFVYPSLIGNYQVRPLPYLLGNAPTVGQSLYIAVIIILNVVLAAIDYQSAQPSAWFGSQWQEISAYVLYRTGAFAFMLFPVVILFSSRNNLLLWLTNWSHSTYLLLHRWVARILMLHILIHSIIGLQIYAHYAKTSWWIWGAVATIATVILTVGSGLYVRKLQYEFFLISHIVLAVFVLVGSWYHLMQWYASMGMTAPDTSGYEVWLYLAFALWAFDRVIRVGRTLKTGAQRAKVTDLGGDYVRVDVPGIRWGSEPGKHAYVYFPTLSPLRPWENHPFSIIPMSMLQPPNQSVESQSAHEDTEKQDHVKTGIRRVTSGNLAGVGITMLVKKSTGLTKHLKGHENLLTLIDGPYNNSYGKDVLRCDRVLLIAGGIGITGLLPWAYNHWNVKVAWSMKDSASCLAETIELSGIVEKEVVLGSRLNITKLVALEAEAGWGMVGVVVSGPGSLCDDVRAAVAAAGRTSKTVFELEVDAYSW